jgi:hypothetical protein
METVTALVTLLLKQHSWQYVALPPVSVPWSCKLKLLFCQYCPSLIINSVVFIISLVLISIAIYRHRKAGGHCKLDPTAMPPPVFAADAENGTSAVGEKVQVPNQAPYQNQVPMQNQAPIQSYPPTPAPEQYYQPPPQQYAPPPMENGQQYQPVPQYGHPQEMPLVASPAISNVTPVQAHPQQPYPQ